MIVTPPSESKGCRGKTNLGQGFARQADRLASKHNKVFGGYRCPYYQMNVKTKIISLVRMMTGIRPMHTGSY